MTTTAPPRATDIWAGSSTRPAGRDQVLVAAIAAVASLPSVLSGLFGGGMLTDDWGVWLEFERRGVIDAMRQLAFEQPARPLTAPYYALIYPVIGDQPVVQALLMGALNAFLVIAAWAAGRQVVPANVLWPSLVVLALAPNHAMTRLWFVLGPNVLALALVMLALALVGRNRVAPGSACFVAGVLLYEGVIVIGVAMLMGLALLRPGRRSAAARAAIAPLGAAATVFLLSPKRAGTGPKPFNNAETFISGQFGVGLWGSPVLGRICGALVLSGLVWAVATQLPSWSSRRGVGRWILGGALLAVLGAAPFFYLGTTFGTTGLFDRNNMLAGVGAAVMLGAMWSVLRSLSRGGALVVGVVVCAHFAALQIEDVRNYADAVRHGDRIVHRLATADVDDSRPILVLPPQLDHGTGLGAFVYSGDLIGAVRARHGGDWRQLALVEAPDCAAVASGSPFVQLFDWRVGTVDRVAAADVRSICAQHRS